MAILVFSGVLSVPSAVFAEASWYGSLRGGLEFGGGEDARYFDGSSRWGVKGSAEASEGLTAVYRFEHKISTKDAGNPAMGRLAYVGLSGGFGTLTMGQIWNAAYNSTGAITDPSYFFGNSHTGYRHGNALSYAYSNDIASFQMDLISDKDTDTGSGFDKAEFGLTVSMGEVGKVAFAHTTVKNTMKMQAESYWVTADNTVEARKITVTYAKSDTTNVNTDGELTGVDAIRRVGNMYRVDVEGSECNAEDADAADACMTTTSYVSSQTMRVAGGDSATMEHETFYLPSQITTTPAKTVVDTYGHKKNHVAVEFNVGGVTPWLGYSQTKKNNETGKMKVTHWGVRGPVGDTGLSFLVSGRQEKAAKEGAEKMNPWYVELTKDLGGGAVGYVGHQNNDDGKSGKSRVGLIVSF